MPNYNRQYQVGKKIFHAIECSGWNPRGQVLRMNPENSTIDKMFATLRSSLKGLERQGYLRKDGRTYHPSAMQAPMAHVALPLRGAAKSYAFGARDIIYARATFKRHKLLLQTLVDWNDLAALVGMLQSRRVKKPVLTAQLIFAAWTYNRTP